MKALTVRQPWAAAIFLPDHAKDVENRGQRTQITGMVAIHAGLRWDPAGQQTVFELTRRMYVDAPGGYILGVVQITGCHLAAPGCCTSPWAQPDARVHITLADPVKLPDPIPCSGARGWWDLPEPVAMAVRARIPQLATGTGATP